MEESSGVHVGSEAYEAPELRVSRVVRGGLVALSDPHLVGVANESFQNGSSVWGGVSGDMSAESFQGASNAWGDGLGGSVGAEQFWAQGGLGYGGVSGGMSAESFQSASYGWGEDSGAGGPGGAPAGGFSVSDDMEW